MNILTSFCLSLKSKLKPEVSTFGFMGGLGLPDAVSAGVSTGGFGGAFVCLSFFSIGGQCENDFQTRVTMKSPLA